MRKPRLGPDDWTAAALTAIGEQGLAGVAVEPLAARLGTTKGSFYWHFPNREALLEAALRSWDETYTDAILRTVDAEPDPVARLQALFVAVTASERAPVEVHLHAAADHPAVAPAMRRAVARRTAYIAAQLTALGFDQAEADRRALFVYATYVGHIQLVVRIPDAIPQGPARDAYLATILAAVLGRPTAAQTGTGASSASADAPSNNSALSP
ncbi:TetR/AcrR family transcriptional regulator [Asanoa sp. WMMD1127]|uniref:TetR/AcrR family transcriptional regulator n=1 Tax=Asanoa sp. WMMD1127 TaxID=3016107 RepID=UPI0024176CE4|nr:TetR/AcrR family transcriptional regulator [Asanoa sp. WMMD1127]MDG4820337.1 TetR/AcrR family transcriptional regulator [Asanoa sp. WMMD1127]